MKPRLKKKRNSPSQDMHKGPKMSSNPSAAPGVTAVLLVDYPSWAPFISNVEKNVSSFQHEAHFKAYSVIDLL